MLTTELTNSREQEKKLKTELVELKDKYTENRYETEMLQEDNTSTNEQLQIAQEAATKRTKEVVKMQKDFQTNIEGIHEDYLERMESAKRKSDMEVDKLKKEVKGKETDIGSKTTNALTELTQEMKTREVKQNEALRSALKTLARKPSGAVKKADMREIK